MLQEFKDARYVVGAKQTRRALTGGQVKKLFLARDADPSLTDPLAAQAEAAGIPVDRSAAMAELGAACAIAVKAACAAILS